MNAKSILKKIWLSLSAVRLIPHICFMKYHPSRECIEQDIERWTSLKMMKGSETDWGTIWTFIRLMTYLPEYRNVFYYRIGWISKILYPLCRPMPTLVIFRVDEGIGPGLVIHNGWATGIGAKKIGRNCHVFQNVTIGYVNPTDKPTIGDNVTITAGAKVLGNVRIGNNCSVGANAVVVKDVPDNCTVIGVPAYIVRRNGVKVNEPL